MAQLGDGREARRDADVAVGGVEAVGVGCARRSHDDTGLGAERKRPFCRSRHRMIRHKVAAHRTGPAPDAQRRDLGVQCVEDGLEFRCENCRVAAHQLQRVCLVAQVADVAELVDLVIADGLDGNQALQIFLIFDRRRHDRHARAGEGDLRGRGEFVDHVGVSGLAAEGQNVAERDKIAENFVDTVRVIPHQREIGRGGTERGDAVDRAVGVDDAVGVGVLRHTPHPLDGGVADGRLDRIHVRPLGGHGDGDQLRAEGFRNAEMAVVAGRGTEKFHDRLLRPRAHGMAQAVGVGLGDEVVHERQAGVAADEYFLRLRTEQLGKQALRRRQTADLAVVPRVDPVVCAVGGVGKHGQNIAYHVELLPAGLAACHVQLEVQRLVMLKFFQQRGIFRLPLCGGQLLVRLHDINDLSGKL